MSSIDRGSISKQVCEKAVGDKWLKQFIRLEAGPQRCSYCGSTPALQLDKLANHVEHCIGTEYVRAGQTIQMPDWEHWFAGYPEGPITLAEDILKPAIAPSHAGLISDLIDLLPDYPWHHHSVYLADEHEVLSAAWRDFEKVVMHERRFHFTAPPSGESAMPIDLDERLTTEELLAAIGAACDHFRLIKRLPAGTLLYRARRDDPERPLCTPAQLGPPDANHARQNRMSPAGIPMFYTATDAHTAIAETYDGNSIHWAIAQFRLARAALIVDLTRLPSRPTLFSSMPVADRHVLRFLHDFAEVISRPIERDDFVHVAYVPSQVVVFQKH